MPLTRKIINLGHSKAICLPKTWIKLHEEAHGQNIEKVLIDVNEKLLISAKPPEPQFQTVSHRTKSANSEED